jgi:hypothetical protein
VVLATFVEHSSRNVWGGGLGNIYYRVACILKFAEAVAVHALALLVDGGVQLELNRVSFFIQDKRNRVSFFIQDKRNRVSSTFKTRKIECLIFYSSHNRASFLIQDNKNRVSLHSRHEKTSVSFSVQLTTGLPFLIEIVSYFHSKDTNI